MVSSWAMHTFHIRYPVLQAMQVLGKLGGRNRRFLKEPVRMDYRDNPEHGLRLILTFPAMGKPGNSFLTPLDKCIMLAKQGLFSQQMLGDSRDPKVLGKCWATGGAVQAQRGGLGR